MKLMHPWLQSPICFRENRIQVLIIENRELFSRLISELCEQSEGKAGNFVLSENDLLLECIDCLDVVVDYFHLNPDKKRLHAKLLNKMKAAAHQELQMETIDLLSHLQKYLATLIEQFDYPLMLEQDSDIAAILKACGPKLQFRTGTLAENLLDYMEVCRDLGKVTCFVLVNCKDYFAQETLRQFYEGILYRKLNVLLLESEQRGKIREIEEIRLIDEEFCELYLAEQAEI